jgi:hypothetical protein
LPNNTSDREGGGLNLAADKHNVNVINCTITNNTGSRFA